MVTRICLAAALAAGLVTGALPPGPVLAQPNVGARPPQRIDLARLLVEADAASQRGDFAAAMALVDTALRSPGFGQLPARHQLAFRLLEGLLAFEMEQPERSIAALRAVIGMDEVPEPLLEAAWSLLFWAEYFHDLPAAAATLTTIARDRPAALAELDDESVLWTAQGREIGPETHGDLRFDLRQALLAADWSGEHDSWLWREHALELLERGRVEAAIAAAGRVAAGEAVLSMRADRRFDPLVEAHGEDRFDVAAAFAGDLERARAAITGAETGLGPRNALAFELFMAGRLDEALAVVDRALELAPPGAPSDLPEADQVNWTLDTRGRVLWAQGRHEEALAVQRQAAALSEDGGANVSQVINLGWLLYLAGEPAEALAALEPLAPEGLSPFGMMQADQVRACAAHALGEAERAGEVLADMAERRRDAPDAYFETLGCVGGLDAAEAFLLERLEDPEMRGQALAGFHSYVPRPGPTPVEQSLAEALAEVRARPQAAAAAARHGRAFQVPTYPPQF